MLRLFVRAYTIFGTLSLLIASIGLASSWGTGRFTSSLIYALSPTDGLTISLTSLTMIAISAFAAHLPARRASRVDPMAALHYE